MPYLNLEPYQFIIAALSFFMIAFSVQRHFKGGKTQTVLKLFVRIAVWGGMLTVILFPSLIYSFTAALGLEGEINPVTLAGFLLVFLIIFKMLSVIERIEYQITLLTRQEALKSIKSGERDDAQA